MLTKIEVAETYCFSIIRDTLVAQSSNSQKIGELVETAFNSERIAPFVTIYKRSRVNWTLRGCIGTFSPGLAVQKLKTYSLQSAFHDIRFCPVRQDELNDLKINVSLLKDFEGPMGPLDWNLSEHGIIIEFEVKGRNYTATFLPDVPKENGWSKENTIEQLVRKSGYSKVQDWHKLNIQLTRYRSEKGPGLEYLEFLNRLKKI